MIRRWIKWIQKKLKKSRAKDIPETKKESRQETAGKDAWW